MITVYRNVYLLALSNGTIADPLRPTA